MRTMWASNAHFLAILDSKVSQNSGLVTFSKSIHSFHISIAPHAQCKYFQLYVHYEPHRPNFGAISGPKISQISGL